VILVYTNQIDTATHTRRGHSMLHDTMEERAREVGDALNADVDVPPLRPKWKQKRLERRPAERKSKKKKPPAKLPLMPTVALWFDDVRFENKQVHGRRGRKEVTFPGSAAQIAFMGQDGLCALFVMPVTMAKHFV